MHRSIVLVVLIAVLAAACGAAEEAVAPETTTTQAATTTTSEAPRTTTSTTTTVPATTTTAASDEIKTSRVVPGEDPDIDAIVEAYVVVFDSATSFDEKAPFIIDTTDLEGTVEEYAAAGDELGGIALQADRVGIDGNEARVIYSFLFAGNAAYSDLEGDALLTEEGWQISREFFCQIMTLARVGCP